MAATSSSRCARSRRSSIHTRCSCPAASSTARRPATATASSSTARHRRSRFATALAAMAPHRSCPNASASGGIPPIPFRVLFVKPGSPAQKAGLRPGDIVREINGVVVDLANAAKAFAALHGAGANRNEPGVQALVVDRAGVKEHVEIAPRTNRLPARVALRRHPQRRQFVELLARQGSADRLRAPRRHRER